MSYKITISNPGNHVANPLLKLRGNTYATREDACEAIYAAMERVIEGDGCEMVDMSGYTHHDCGMLFWCDRGGNNCEPLNADDEPYTIDDADMCDIGDSSLALRRAAINDDCDPRITHVVTDQDGDIKSYLRWREYDEYACPMDDYCSACYDYILREGYATEDGVTATVEEIPVVKLHDINGCMPEHNPCMLAIVVMDGRKYMAVQTRPHEAMPATWANPVVARIPMDWTMDRLLSSGDGVCDPIWSIVAHGYGEGCEIVTDAAELNAVIKAIEEA